MKFLSWFICIIIFAMSCVPCADAATYTPSSSATTFSKTYSSEKHQDQGLDECSPFCVCTCCNTPTVMRQTVILPSFPSEITQKYADLTVRKVISSTLSIWQPPKLG